MGKKKWGLFGGIATKVEKIILKLKTEAKFTGEWPYCKHCPPPGLGLNTCQKEL